jgi:hypothetical protein
MKRREPFLHMIDCEDICGTGQSVQQAVFESEARCWAYDGRFWEERPCHLLGFALKYVNSAALMEVPNSLP